MTTTLPSRTLTLDGAKIHYLEQGTGDPILFLHSIPASSYVWRNVIPRLSPLGRCIAPDLIGTGASDQPNIDYSVFDHIHYIEQFIEKLNLQRITLVMHGWGSVIGLAYAMKNPARCKGLVFYEAFLRADGEEELSLPFQEQQQFLENAQVSGAYYIDHILPQEMLKKLAASDMQEYRGPCLRSRFDKVLQQYLTELPRADRQTKVDELIADYSKKLTKSNLPKLLLYSSPGFVMTMATIMWAKENFPRLEVVDVGEELHYAQESNPILMGESISIWLQGIEQTRG